MKYTNLEGISKRASRLVYGTVQPVYAGSREEAFEALDAAWEAGFRIFDTAHSYGEDAHAEKNFGAWIEARGVQDEVIILDKGFNPGQKGCPDVYSAQMLRDQIEESLQNLRTDCLDIYILHRDDPRYPVDEIVEVLNEYHDKGAILRFGGSNWTYERTLEANRYAKEHGLTGFTVCEPNFSLAVLERDPWGGSETISGENHAQYRAYLSENRIPVFNYSSLARGYMSGKFDPRKGVPIDQCIAEAPILEYDSPANRARLTRVFEMAEEKGITVPQLSLAWLLHQDLEIFPLIAPSARHIAENLAALDVELTQQEADWLLNG